MKAFVGFCLKLSLYNMEDRVGFIDADEYLNTLKAFAQTPDPSDEDCYKATIACDMLDVADLVLLYFIVKWGDEYMDLVQHGHVAAEDKKKKIDDVCKKKPFSMFQVKQLCEQGIISL